MSLILNNEPLQSLLKRQFNIEHMFTYDYKDIKKATKRALLIILKVTCCMLTALEEGDWYNLTVQEKEKAFSTIVDIEKTLFPSFCNALRKNSADYNKELENSTIYELYHKNNLMQLSDENLADVEISPQEFLYTAFELLGCKKPFLKNAVRYEDAYGITYNTLTKNGQKVYGKITDILSALIDIPCLLDDCDEMVNTVDC